jgi:hypothetical protein
MTKRNPQKSKQTKEAAEQKKRTAAFKTAVPLVLTLLLLGAVYLFVLLPESPANALKGAILNSLDSEKQKSFRYDGSFGDTNRGIAGEYAGQKASNGDSEFRVRLKDDEKNTSIEIKSVEDTNYVRIEGVENLNTTLSKITGVVELNDQTVELLTALQGKWIELSPASERLVQAAVPCMDKLPGFREQSTAPQMNSDNYPFVLTAGPYSNNDDSEDDVYEAKLSPDRTLTAPEDGLTDLANCLESSYGENDFRLRDSTKSDEQSMNFVFTVDPLSNTVKKVVVKQVGQYFQLVIRDYNKDITISPPEDAQSVLQVYRSLLPEQQSLITGNTGIDIGSVLQ